MAVTADRAAHGSGKGPTRVGELRPSQLLTTFGVGATVDLPNLTVVVMGLDDWNVGFTTAVTEDRLLAAVRRRLGRQVSALRTPPYLPESENPFDDWARIGVPVVVFPRWLRCPRCALLAPVATGLFELKTHPVRTDRIRYQHTNCSGKGGAPTALAARFLLACPAGHLDDFPWVEFTHGFQPCAAPRLELRELGVTGRAAEVQVRCSNCDTQRRMSDAFGEDAHTKLARCRGRHPHLGSFATARCDEPARAILLGASNEWFGMRLRVLSIPAKGERLAQLVAAHWAILEVATSLEVLTALRLVKPELGAFSGYSDEEVWAAIQAHRDAGGQPAADTEDLLGPEWEAFSDPDHAPSGGDFQLRGQPPPEPFTDRVAQVVLAERLREVQALVGFTRIDAPDELRPDPSLRPAPLTRGEPLWVPCSEVRGEGVFLRLAEAPLAAWEQDAERSRRAGAFRSAWRAWCLARSITDDPPWPGMRYVLLHSLAHALITEFALECGYGAAGLAERLYARPAAGGGPGDGPMAGLLLYTSAPDSEGTLGGLVELGEPDRLGQLLVQALERARLCSSDPLCAEHEPVGRALHGAACHACMFAPETSCQSGNRFLDRSLLVTTFASGGLAFFT